MKEESTYSLNIRPVKSNDDDSNNNDNNNNLYSQVLKDLLREDDRIEMGNHVWHHYVDVFPASSS